MGLHLFPAPPSGATAPPGAGIWIPAEVLERFELRLIPLAAGATALHAPMALPIWPEHSLAACVPLEPPAAILPAALPPELRNVEANIIEASPGPGERPANLRQLATRAGYAYSPHFREAVQGLADRGLLVRARGGFRRPV